MKTSDAITHQIIYTAARLEAIAEHYVFSPMGTTAASMKVLRLVKKNGPLSQNRISELGGGTKSNVSQRLDNLEKNGYIFRDQQTPKDKRKVLVKITRKGRLKLFEIDKRMKKAQICLEKNFTKKEIEDNEKFLKKIDKLLEKNRKVLDKIFANQ